MHMNDRRPVKLALAVLSAAVLTSGLALAQAGGGPALPSYDKATEITLKGPIQEVKLVDTPSGVQGTRLMLKQGQQLVEVYAGPAPFFTRQAMTFAKGEPVEVIGSKVQIKGASALLARQIKKGAKTVVVRDEAGKPAWNKPPA
jgi:hypothetical protein